MLNKLFGSWKRKPPFGSLVPVDPIHARFQVVGKSSSALKIIHAGGTTECYYMAVPAARIMEKYPSFILARPEIFWRPWDSVVQPDEILVPGQKFFLVPLRTVKKLRRRIRKPIKDNFASSFISESSISDVSAELVYKQQDELTSKSFLLTADVSKSIIRTLKSKGKNKARVSFVGIETDKKRNTEDHNGLKKSSNKSGERKRRVRNAVTWEPSLTVIAESHGSDE